ncbi:MAG: MFS transporter [Pseudomonadales bacterium]
MPSRLYYGYVLIGAAFIAQFVSTGILSYVAGSFMAPMSEDLGWTRADFTLARSVAQLITGLAGFFIGVQVDRLGGRRLMLAGTCILSVALVLLGFVDALWQWIVVNGVIATLGCALIGNLVVNVTLAKWFVERRGQAVAWAAMGVSLGGVVLTPSVTWAIDHFGWRQSWVGLGVAVGLIMVPVAALMRRAPEDFGLHPDGRSQADVDGGLADKAQRDYELSMTRRQAVRTRSFYALVVAFGFFSINIVVVLLHMVPMLTDAGFTRAQAAAAMVVASVPAMLSKPVWGYFIDRLHAKPLAAVSASATGLSLAFIVAAVHAGSLTGVYAALLLLGLGWGGMIPLQEVIWGSFFGRRYLGAVRSAALPFALLLGAIAPYLVSVYRDATGEYAGALLTVAVLNMLSGVLIHRVRPPVRSSEQGAPGVVTG